MGPNINYKGVELAIKMAKMHENAFLYVIETHRINNIAHLIGTIHDRDLDIVQESPGIDDDS